MLVTPAGSYEFFYLLVSNDSLPMEIKTFNTEKQVRLGGLYCISKKKLDASKYATKSREWNVFYCSDEIITMPIL